VTQDGSSKQVNDNLERDKAVAETIAKASAVLKEAALLDAGIADAELKYSEWLAALATAGLGVLLSVLDKLHDNSWLIICPTLLSSLIAVTSVLFLLAIACSATVLRLFRLYKADFSKSITLSSTQETLLLNHVAIVAAMAQMAALLRGNPKSFRDVVYSDIVDRIGGLARNEFTSSVNADNQCEGLEEVAEEWTWLTNNLEMLRQRSADVQKSQEKNRRWLTRFGRAQQLLCGAAYAILPILAFPGR
jgi:hypothetical protein